MKNFIALAFIFLSFSAFAQKDYTIEIDGKTMEIALDQPYMIEINGKKTVFTVKAKDTLVYDDLLYKFKYTKEYRVSRTEVAEGIEQIMIMTAEGSGMLIQKYSTINPEMFNEIMLNEVTKESINYGFEMQKEKFTRTLKSGHKLEVTRASLNYQDETNVYEIASIGKKDEGILIMTMVMNTDLSSMGKKIIDLMWNSLELK